MKTRFPLFKKRILPWSKNRSSSRNIGIKGHKIILREKRLEDARDDYLWRTDTELSELDDTKPLKISYEQFFELYKEELKHKGIWSRRFAIVTSNEKHIGNCMYYNMDDYKKQTEIGIMIGDKNYWNLGYGADSIKTLVEYLFDTTSVNRIYLHTLEWNKRAKTSFSKAGFVEVKRVIRGGNMFLLMEMIRTIHTSNNN